MKYLLSSKTGILSARILSGILGIKCYTTINKTNRHSPPLIRWGNTDTIEDWKEDTQYNTISSIDIVSNKLAFSNFCKENNISHVELQRGRPNKYPVFVRKLLNGHGGEGIEIIRNEDDFITLQKYFYSYFIPFEFELRVHLVSGIPIKVFKKFPPEEGEKEFPIRNVENGYHFGLREVKNYPKANQLCELLYEKLNINMCGVDLGYNREEKKYYIIEVNSCPGLNEQTANIYANILKEKLNI